MARRERHYTRDGRWRPGALLVALLVCAVFAATTGCDWFIPPRTPAPEPEPEPEPLQGRLEVRAAAMHGDVPEGGDYDTFGQVMANGGTFDLGAYDHYAEGYRYFGVEIRNVGDAAMVFEGDVTATIVSDPVDSAADPVFTSLEGTSVVELYSAVGAFHPGYSRSIMGLLDSSHLVCDGQKRATIRILEGDTEIFAVTLTVTYASSVGSITVQMEDLTDVAVDADTRTHLYAGGSHLVDIWGRVLLDGTSGCAFEWYTPPGMEMQRGYPDGEYTVVVYVDDDDDGIRDVGEHGYMTTFELAGDRLITIGLDEWEEMVAEAVTASVANAPEGSTLVCVWCLPDGGLGSWQGLSAGAFASGASATTINTTLIPGRYDLYCYVDLDGSTNLAYPTGTWRDAGEPELLIPGVVITGAGTTVTGTFVPALEREPDTSIDFLVDFYGTWMLAYFSAAFGEDEDPDPDTHVVTLTSEDDPDVSGSAIVTIYAPGTGDSTLTFVFDGFSVGTGTFYTSVAPHIVVLQDAASSGSWSGRVDATGAYSGYIVTDNVDVVAGELAGTWDVSGVEHTSAELVAAME